MNTHILSCLWDIYKMDKEDLNLKEGSTVLWVVVWG